MCRNIKTLFNFEPPATKDEVHAASLQYVRKVTGFNKLSRANEAAFYPRSKTSRDLGAAPRLARNHCSARHERKRRPRREHARP